jgi:hypothetical protein
MFSGYQKKMNIQQTVLQLLLLCVSFVKCEHLLQTLTATVGGDNYTHYRLSTQGRLHIVVESVVGDADLYISDTTLSPTFDDYAIQSNTCGREEVEIPSSMKRPVGIGIFGHPNYVQTEYQLSIYFVTQYDDTDYAQLSKQYDIVDGEDGSSDGYTDTSSHFNLHGADQQEEGESVWSILGTILSTILKIIFEVLL